MSKISKISYSTMEAITKEIFLANARNLYTSVFVEVKDGFDVVTNVDFANEAKIREILTSVSKAWTSPTKEIETPISLAGIYGEETGYQKVSDDGELYAIIDPIDGTRDFVNGIFYSAVSVALVNKAGDTVAGILILINNQINDPYKPEKYELFIYNEGKTFIGKLGYLRDPMGPCPYIRLHFEEFKTDITQSTLNKECISLTDVKAYAEQWDGTSEHNSDGCYIHQFMRDHSRCLMGFCSGAAEIMQVVKNRHGGFINLGKWDIVSHPVALAIASATPGISVEHVYSDGSDFRIDVSALATDQKNKFLGGDGSVIIGKSSLKLREKILSIKEIKQL